MITKTVTIRILAILSIVCTPSFGWGATDEPDVDAIKVAQVKAAFLLNFLKFTVWPEDTFTDKRTPIKVGIIGDPTMQKVLDQSLAKGKAHNRTIEIEYFDIPDPKKTADKDELATEFAALQKATASCQLVYITEAETAAYEESCSDLAISQTLLVSDNADLLKNGVHLAFEIDDGHVVFRAAVTTIMEMTYKLSSKLLSLARPADKDK